MGKGDRRTRRGKIWHGSYGKFRKKKSNKKHTESENSSSESEKE
jgi:30S ribosomal protein S31